MQDDYRASRRFFSRDVDAMDVSFLNDFYDCLLNLEKSRSLGAVSSGGSPF